MKITVNADYNGAVITLYELTNGYPHKLESSIGRLDSAEYRINSDKTYYAVVSIDDKEGTHTIELKAVDSAVQTVSEVATTSTKSKSTTKSTTEW